MAEVIAFPQDRNIGKARHVAELWLAKGNDRDRQLYWLSLERRFRRLMERLGFCETDIASQILLFETVCRDQIDELTERQAAGGQCLGSTRENHDGR